MIMKDILELYEEYLYINYTKNTLKTYQVEIRKFVIFYEKLNKEMFLPQNVTQIDIRDYERYLTENLLDTRSPNNPKKLSYVTVNKKIEALKNFFIWCQQEGYIINIPTEYLKNKKTQNREATIKWLNRSEKNKLVRVMSDIGLWKKQNLMKRNKAIVYLMLFAGLRLSEVQNLLKQDIDETKMIINVIGKGDKNRKVDLNKELLKSLKEWLEVNDSNSPYLFASQKNSKITTQGIQHIFKKIRFYTQNEEITPHVLRHTFCHDLAELGYNLTVIADLVGHESLDTTRIYTTSSREERRSAVDSLI